MTADKPRCIVTALKPKRARTPKEQPPLVASIVAAHTPERIKRWRAITGRDE
jgi:hypothetical protein